MSRLPPAVAVLAASLSCLPGLAVAQPSFDEVTPMANPYFQTPEPEDFWVSAVAPADVDGDGDLDLAVLGFHVVYDVSVEDRLVILDNQGEGSDGQWQFVPQPVPVGEVIAGASDLAWGDFDGDGDKDLALGSEGATVIYRNDAGSLTPLKNVLPGYWEDSAFSIAYDLRSLAWADTDNDGDLDLLLPSVFDFDSFEFRTVLLRNDGSDGLGGWWFTESDPSGLDATFNAQSAFADDDGDGDLDLMLLNVDSNGDDGFIRRYDNEAGVFTGAPLLNITVEHGIADWGDHDGDGDHDVLIAGNIHDEDDSFRTVLRVYDNAEGVLTPQTLLEMPSADWLDVMAATWADYDSDGDMDILMTGSFIGDSKIVGKSDIFLRQDGSYAALGLNLPAPVDSVGRGGTFTWFDVDGDGDLDYLVAGAYYVEGRNGLVEARMHLYRNATTATNATPQAPSGLQATPVPDGIVLSWLPAIDDHTPTAQLTYELEILGEDVPADAARRLPEPGNISTATAWTLTGLPDGQYSWHVRAVDSAFAGGEFASGQFAIGDTLFANGFEANDR